MSHWPGLPLRPRPRLRLRPPGSAASPWATSPLARAQRPHCRSLRGFIRQARACGSSSAGASVRKWIRANSLAPGKPPNPGTFPFPIRRTRRWFRSASLLPRCVARTFASPRSRCARRFPRIRRPRVDKENQSVASATSVVPRTVFSRERERHPRSRRSARGNCSVDTATDLALPSLGGPRLPGPPQNSRATDSAPRWSRGRTGHRFCGISTSPVCRKIGMALLRFAGTDLGRPSG